MIIPRLPWDQYWMVLAHLTATRSTCDRGPELLFDPGRHGVGAILVRNKRVIAGGYNGSAPGQPHCSDPKYRCRKCGAGGETKKEIKHGYLQHWQDGENVGDPPLHDDYFIDEYGGHLMRDGHCVRTIHSEMNALLQCALDGVSPNGATLYCTASPCFDCAKAIIRAGIEKVFYGQAYDSRYGLSGDVKNLLIKSGIPTQELVITREDLR